MADLNEVLGVDNIVGMIQAIKPGLNRTLPDSYYAVNRTVHGDMVSFDEEDGERKTSKIGGRDAPARQIEVDGVRQTHARCLSPKEKMSVKPTDLENLRAPGGSRKEKRGKSEVARKVGRLNTRLDNTRIATAEMMLLGGGVIYYDNDGNLLADDTGAVNTVDAGIPATNLSRIKDMDGNDILTDWAVVTADIVGQMRKLHDTALKRTGYKLSTVVYGADVIGHLCANNCVGNMMNSFAALSASMANLSLPSGFLGFQNWISGSGAFWVDEDGTHHNLVGDEEICFLPEMDASWFENVEGSFPVPNTDGVFGSLVEANESFVDVTGKYGYAWIEKDPPGASGVVGDTYLPFIKVPGVVYKGYVGT